MFSDYFTFRASPNRPMVFGKMATAIAATLARWLKRTSTAARMTKGPYNPSVITNTFGRSSSSSANNSWPGPANWPGYWGVVTRIDYLVSIAPSTSHFVFGGPPIPRRSDYEPFNTDPQNTLFLLTKRGLLSAEPLPRGRVILNLRPTLLATQNVNIEQRAMGDFVNF